MNHSVFRHYKGGLYQLLMENVYSESDPHTELVVYLSLTDGRIWTRSYEEFYGLVEYEGQQVPRFNVVEVNSKGELVAAL